MESSLFYHEVGETDDPTRRARVYTGIMILPDPIRERHRRALEHIVRLEARLDALADFMRLWQESNQMGFLRVSDACSMMNFSRPTLDRLIEQRAVREFRLFDQKDGPRVVSVVDLYKLPAVVMRSGDSAEVRRTRRRYYDGPK